MKKFPSLQQNIRTSIDSTFFVSLMLLSSDFSMKTFSSEKRLPDLKFSETQNVSSDNGPFEIWPLSHRRKRHSGSTTSFTRTDFWPSICQLIHNGLFFKNVFIFSC